MFSKRIPFYYALFTTLLGSFVSYLIFNHVERIISDNPTPSVTPAQSSGCSYSQSRLDGYEYVKPLMTASQACESERFIPLKEDLTALLEKFKNDGLITSGSVYLREFKYGQWFSLNEQEKFNPGSLLKVPVLIAYLRMEEINPGTLEHKYSFDRPFENVIKTPLFLSKGVQLGHTYSVRELLHYLIAFSDNNANYILFEHMDPVIFKKVFTDLGLAAPDLSAANYPISARDYSIFIEALFDAGYLSMKNSEYAMSLLAECDFKLGFVKGIPGSTKIAHKFGESGTNDAPELHESAVVYLNNDPYVLTLMTRGKDRTKMTEVLSAVSSCVFNHMPQYNL
jgi:beta-lactamase class A